MEDFTTALDRDKQERLGPDRQRYDLDGMTVLNRIVRLVYNMVETDQIEYAVDPNHSDVDMAQKKLKKDSKSSTRLEMKITDNGMDGDELRGACVLQKLAHEVRLS